MPKFVAHLEAQDGSGNFRRTVIFSASEEEARRTLRNREFAAAMYRLDTDELAQLEEKETAAHAAGLELSKEDRSKLATHRQEQPYELTYFGTTDPPRKTGRKPKHLRGGE